MTNEQEQDLKIRARINEHEQQLRPMTAGTIGCTIGGPNTIQAGLRDRIRAQRHRSEYESTRARQLVELDDLLEKNPEVARILELMDAVAPLGFAR